MASQKDNLAALAKMGITKDASAIEGILPLKGDESAAQVAEVLKNAKAIVAANKKDDKDENDGAQVSNQGGESAGTLLVWVKGRTYIDAKRRIDGGLYRLAEVPERLAKSSRDVVETFADGISPRKMVEIAKWCGVSHPEDFTDEELLEKIVVNELRPF